MKTLTVIIPSRSQPLQKRFLHRAVASIRRQQACAEVAVDILVGVDAGEGLDTDFCAELGLTCYESAARSQADALNACLVHAKGDYVAFLEDDDQWHPQYLDTVRQCLSLTGADMVSSTQAEVDEQGAFIRVNDFPTPSGWTIARTTVRRAGLFDQTFRFHLDNEYLGRLSAHGTTRAHLVEAYAPVDYSHAVTVRPWLARVIHGSNRSCRLVRHPHPEPLVTRMVHRGSGMYQIARDAQLGTVSAQEFARLNQLYGRIPW